MSYAIIKTGGKQFFVAEGNTVRVPLIEEEAGKSVELDALLTAGKDGDAGPVLGATRVSATIVAHGRGPKFIVFKKKRRKHYKRKQGHRQGYTTIRIDRISESDK